MSWAPIALALLAAGIRKFIVPPSSDATRRAATGTARHKPENPDTSFEPSDWDVAPVAFIFVGILVLLVISCFALIAGFPGALPDVARTLRISPPGPHLATNARSELERVRSEEETRLNSYYWIDRSKGQVHIPIGQAMEKLAGTGIDGFPKGNK